MIHWTTARGVSAWTNGANWIAKIALVLSHVQLIEDAILWRARRNSTWGSNVKNAKSNIYHGFLSVLLIDTSYVLVSTTSHVVSLAKQIALILAFRLKMQAEDSFYEWSQPRHEQRRIKRQLMRDLRQSRGSWLRAYPRTPATLSVLYAKENCNMAR